MSKQDLSISEMKEMQSKLFQQHKEEWGDRGPKYAKSHILYMIEEIGECISIIKKKGITQIMEKQEVRDRFTEEFSDVLMYYTEVLNRLDISAEELSNAYIKKHEYNMNRNYTRDNEEKYNKTTF